LSDLKASRTKTESSDSKRRAPHDYETFNPATKIMHDQDFTYLSSD